MVYTVGFCCYHVYELRYTLCPIYFRLMAAIFDFQHAQTQNCILSSLSVLLDLGNMGVADGISLLSCIRAGYTVCPIYFRKLAAIFDFQHAQTYDRIVSSIFVLPDPGNMCVAVGISLLSCL